MAFTVLDRVTVRRQQAPRLLPDLLPAIGAAAPIAARGLLPGDFNHAGAIDATIQDFNAEVLR